MIYLILAIISSACTSIAMRFSEKYVQNKMGMFMVNYGMCFLLAQIFMGDSRIFTTQSGIWFAVLLGVLSGALLILLLISGITDSMANIYDKAGASSLKDHYLFYTFFAAFLIAGIFAVQQRIRSLDWTFGVLIGIPNYFSARFLLMAVGEVPAVIVYPAYSVTAIVIITLVGVSVFREKLSKKKAFALGLILVSLVLLNL